MHGKLKLIFACRYEAAWCIRLVQRQRFREVGTAVWVPTIVASFPCFPSSVGHSCPTHLQFSLHSTPREPDRSAPRAS
jgi:hypothetical protein